MHSCCKESCLVVNCKADLLRSDVCLVEMMVVESALRRGFTIDANVRRFAEVSAEEDFELVTNHRGIADRVKSAVRSNRRYHICHFRARRRDPRSGTRTCYAVQRTAVIAPLLLTNDARPVVAEGSLPTLHEPGR